MVRVADLFEAEGRSLRRNTVRVGTALALMLAGGLTALLAVAFVMLAVYLSLYETAIGPEGAAAACALLCAGIAAGLFLVARRIAK